MAKERYTVTSELNTSGTADTSTFALGGISAASRGFEIYEFLAAVKGAQSDTRHIAEISRTTTTITAGGAVTPEVLYTGGAAATSTWSTAPTGATLAANPMKRLTFNGRATVRWAALDPDSRLMFQAAGGTAGTVVVVNRNSAAAAIATENEVSIAE
jgi:hypothetical protein